MILARPIFSVKHLCARKTLVVLGRISDLLKFLVPKVGESFVLDHNVESQEAAQAMPRPELAGTLETILELGFCRLCLHLKISDLDHSDQKYVRVNID
jgi:hypothetical protein